MANINAPFGGRLVGHLYASSYNARIRQYLTLSTYATPIYIGDFVSVTGESGVNEVGVTLPVIEATSGLGPLVGIVVGVVPSSSRLDKIYREAHTQVTLLVCDDPYALFDIQANGILAPNDLQLNANIGLGTPTESFGISGMTLDGSTAVIYSAQLRILAYSNLPTNEPGEFAICRCIINEHIYKHSLAI